MADLPGLLAIWTDVAPEYQAEFHAWYDREHLRERAEVPGFRNARRYRGTESPEFLAVYDTDSLAVLSSPAYQQRLANQTDWSKRVFKGFSNTVRVTAEVVGSAGGGYGGCLMGLRCVPLPGKGAIARTALGGIAAVLLKEPGVVRVAAAMGEVSGLNVFGTGACDPSDPARGVIIVEGSDPAALEALGRGTLSDAALGKLGLGPPGSRGVYTLQYAVTR